MPEDQIRERLRELAQEKLPWLEPEEIEEIIEVYLPYIMQVYVSQEV